MFTNQEFYLLGHNDGSAGYLLHADFTLGLFMDSEDRGDMFLQKHRLTFNGLHKAALYPRGQNSLQPLLVR
jgi:hypothetical protein